MVYRFRFVSDRYPKFSMEVEIKEDQSFYEFHEFIQDELEYDTSHLAAFHVCSHSWISKQEIALMAPKGKSSEVLLMDKSIIKTFIKDAHQKFTYCYDLINNRCFKIELIETKQETQNMYYPVCTAFTGDIPPQFDSGKGDSLFDDDEEEEETPKKIKKPVLDDFDDELLPDESFAKDLDFGFTPDDDDSQVEEEEEEEKDEYDDDDDDAEEEFDDVDLGDEDDDK